MQKICALALIPLLAAVLAGLALAQASGDDMSRDAIFSGVAEALHEADKADVSFLQSDDLLGAAAGSWQPEAVDTLLFTISLTSDSTSLFYIDWSEDLRRSLAGPVLMSGNRLLFHSRHGYVLYDMRGRLIEQHSFTRENLRAAAAGRPQTFFAYPFDGETVIYYTDTDPVAVFRKRLRGRIERVPAAEMEVFRDIRQFEPFNIYRSGTTEDVVRKAHLRQHLAGFTSLDGGSRWWSADLFFSFGSPMIMETDGRFASFFPGLSEDGGNCGISTKFIQPLGVFSREGRWYYLGLYSLNTGTTEDRYFQTIILSDQAGNVQYCSRLLKHEVKAVVVGQSHDYRNRSFTMRKVVRHVFVPAVDAHGDIFYGIVDREQERLEVYKRSYARFLPSPAAPAFADEFDRAGRLSFDPVRMECSDVSRAGILPEVFMLNDQGDRDRLDEIGLTRDNFYVKIHRLSNENLRRKVSHSAPTMPANIAVMQDSISKLTTLWCPYGISVNHDIFGTLSTLSYGFNDVVVAAWVLGTSETGNIYVRVDLENRAEIVVFSNTGHFLERFTFNNTHYRDRRYAVVLAPNDMVYGRNDEAGTNARGRAASGHRFTVWKKGILPLIANREQPPPSPQQPPPPPQQQPSRRRR
jgi:hypothetical protein